MHGEAKASPDSPTPTGLKYICASKGCAQEKEVGTTIKIILARPVQIAQLYYTHSGRSREVPGFPWNPPFSTTSSHKGSAAEAVTALQQKLCKLAS